MTIRFLKLSLASPESIRSWTERILPNGKKVGKILKGDLIDYKNGLPIRDGLSCERIFGPMVSFTCSCGRFKCIETRGIHIVHDTFRTPRQASPVVTRQNKRWGEPVNSEPIQTLEQNNIFGFPKDNHFATHTSDNKQDRPSINLSTWREELGTVLPFPSVTPRDFIIGSTESMILKRIPYHIPFFFKDFSYLCDHFQYFCYIVTKNSGTAWNEINFTSSKADILCSKAGKSSSLIESRLPLPYGRPQRFIQQSAFPINKTGQRFPSSTPIILGKDSGEGPKGKTYCMQCDPIQQYDTLFLLLRGQEQHLVLLDTSLPFLKFNKLKLHNIGKRKKKNKLFKQKQFIIKNLGYYTSSHHFECNLFQAPLPSPLSLECNSLYPELRLTPVEVHYMQSTPPRMGGEGILYAVEPRPSRPLKPYVNPLQWSTVGASHDGRGRYIVSSGTQIVSRSSKQPNTSRQRLTKGKKEKRLHLPFHMISFNGVHTSYPHRLQYTFPSHRKKQSNEAVFKPLYKYLFQIYTRFQFDLKVRYNDFINKKPLVFNRYKIKKILKTNKLNFLLTKAEFFNSLLLKNSRKAKSRFCFSAGKSSELLESRPPLPSGRPRNDPFFFTNFGWKYLISQNNFRAKTSAFLTGTRLRVPLHFSQSWVGILAKFRFCFPSEKQNRNFAFPSSFYFGVRTNKKQNNNVILDSFSQISTSNFSFFSFARLNMYQANRTTVYFLNDKANWNWVPFSFLSRDEADILSSKAEFFNSKLLKNSRKAKSRFCFSAGKSSSLLESLWEGRPRRFVQRSWTKTSAGKSKIKILLKSRLPLPSGRTRKKTNAGPYFSYNDFILFPKRRSSHQFYAISDLNQNIGKKKAPKLHSIIENIETPFLKKEQEPLTSLVSNSSFFTGGEKGKKIQASSDVSPQAKRLGGTQNVGLPRPSRVYKFKTFPPEEIRYCPICEVELLPNSIRRYRLGYIEFVSPVTHIWYTATPIPLLLNLSKTLIEGIAACHEALSSGFPPVYKWSYNGSEPTSWTFQMQPLKLPINLLSISPSYLFKPHLYPVIPQAPPAVSLQAKRWGGMVGKGIKDFEDPFQTISKLSDKSKISQSREYFIKNYYGSDPAIENTHQFHSNSSWANPLSPNLNKICRISFITSYNSYGNKYPLGSPTSIFYSQKKKNKEIFTFPPVIVKKSNTADTLFIRRNNILFPPPRSAFTDTTLFNSQGRSGRKRFILHWDKIVKAMKWDPSMLETEYSEKSDINIFPYGKKKEKAQPFVFLKSGFLYNNTWFKETMEQPYLSSSSWSYTPSEGMGWDGREGHQVLEERIPKKQTDNSFNLHQAISIRPKPNTSFINSDVAIDSQNLYNKDQILSVWPAILQDSLRKKDNIGFASIKTANSKKNKYREDRKLKRETLKLSELESLPIPMEWFPSFQAESISARIDAFGHPRFSLGQVLPAVPNDLSYISPHGRGRCIVSGGREANQWGGTKKEIKRTKRKNRI